MPALVPNLLIVTMFCTVDFAFCSERDWSGKNKFDTIEKSVVVRHLR